MNNSDKKHVAVTSEDVALRLISLSFEKQEQINKTKTMKMTYFAYAWYLVASNNQSRLYNDENFGYINGPVPHSLYENWDSIYKKAKNGNIGDLKHPKVEKIVEKVFNTYNAMDKKEIVEISHQDTAWVTSRSGLNPFAISEVHLEDDLIFKDYSEKINI